MQTRQLQQTLARLGCANTHYVPGYRTAPELEINRGKSSGLRYIFLSQIRREKGPFVLLEALRSVARSGASDIRCDFYGPIFDEDKEEFDPNSEEETEPEIEEIIIDDMAAKVAPPHEEAPGPHYRPE